MSVGKHDRAWALISLKLCGEADEQALQELEHLLKTNPELAGRLQLLEACWHRGSDESKINTAPFFDRLLGRLEQ